MLLHMNLWLFFFDFFFDNDINRLLKNLVFVHVCGVDWMYSFNNFYQLHNVYPVWCGNRVSVVIIYLLFLYVKQNNCVSLETTTTDLLCLNQQARTIWVVQFLEISKVLSISMDPLNEVSIFSILHKSLISLWNCSSTWHPQRTFKKAISSLGVQVFNFKLWRCHHSLLDSFHVIKMTCSKIQMSYNCRSRLLGFGYICFLPRRVTSITGTYLLSIHFSSGHETIFSKCSKTWESCL